MKGRKTFFWFKLGTESEVAAYEFTTLTCIPVSSRPPHVLLKPCWNCCEESAFSGVERPPKSRVRASRPPNIFLRANRCELQMVKLGGGGFGVDYGEGLSSQLIGPPSRKSGRPPPRNVADLCEVKLKSEAEVSRCTGDHSLQGHQDSAAGPPRDYRRGCYWKGPRTTGKVTSSTF